MRDTDQRCARWRRVLISCSRRSGKRTALNLICNAPPTTRIDKVDNTLCSGAAGVENTRNVRALANKTAPSDCGSGATGSKAWRGSGVFMAVMFGRTAPAVHVQISENRT